MRRNSRLCCKPLCLLATLTDGKGPYFHVESCAIHPFVALPDTSCLHAHPIDRGTNRNGRHEREGSTWLPGSGAQPAWLQHSCWRRADGSQARAAPRPPAGCPAWPRRRRLRPTRLRQCARQHLARPGPPCPPRATHRAARPPPAAPCPAGSPSNLSSTDTST